MPAHADVLASDMVDDLQEPIRMVLDVDIRFQERGIFCHVMPLLQFICR